MAHSRVMFLLGPPAQSQVKQSESALRRRDFTFFDWGMIIKVHRSKVIQFREGVLEIPLARCANQELCAVFWTRKHFMQLEAEDGEMAFRIPGPRESSIQDAQIFCSKGRFGRKQFHISLIEERRLYLSGHDRGNDRRDKDEGD